MDRESGWRATAKSQPAICPPFFLYLLKFVSIDCQLAGCHTRQGVSQTRCQTMAIPEPSDGHHNGKDKHCGAAE